MGISVYGPLVSALQASAFMAGVSVAFGEEMIDAQDQNLPYVVVVPIGGPWKPGPGYCANIHPETQNIWETEERCDVHLWAFSSVPNAQPADHADAVWTLQQQVLSAFQDQRAQANSDGSAASGLYWKPISGDWKTAQNATDRYGRGYVFHMMADISIPMAAPSGQATITSEQVNTTVTQPQHVA